MNRRGFLVGAAGLAAAGLAGCAKADKSQPAGTTASSGTGASATSGTSMSGMNMASGVSTKVPEVNGIKPVASQVLATSHWQHMTIQARTMTPTPFLTNNGTSPDGTLDLQLVEPPKDASFHLMVMLNDEYTGEPIPYASVWATILDGKGRQVYHDTQWPMISAYMGPHYGNNVALPGPGDYTLKLLISPPASARHLEYRHVWLTKHQVIEHFTWKPTP